MDSQTQRERSRSCRTGPSARAAGKECAEAAQLEKAERNRLYQQCHCKKRALQREGVEIFTIEIALDETDTISTWDASRVVQKIVRCIFDEL